MSLKKSSKSSSSSSNRLSSQSNRLSSQSNRLSSQSSKSSQSSSSSSKRLSNRSSNSLSNRSNSQSSQSNRQSSQSNILDSQIFDIILDLQSKHMDDFKKLFDLYKALKTLNLELLHDLFKNNNKFLDDIIRVLTQYFDYLLQFIDYIKDKDIKRLNYKSPPNQPPPTPLNRPPPPKFLLSIKEEESIILLIILSIPDFESLKEKEKLEQILNIFNLFYSDN